MYELLMVGDGGSPFTQDSTNPKVLRTCTGRPVRLIGDVRRIMFELMHDPRWASTRIGISSRTDEPSWARELLEKFTIDENDFDDDDSRIVAAECLAARPPLGSTFSFPLKQVFTPMLCELAKDSKIDHVERILLNAGDGISMRDILFFDNEFGNCRQVAKIGVSVCYCPEGVTNEHWKKAIASFPSNNGKIIEI